MPQDSPARSVQPRAYTVVRLRPEATQTVTAAFDQPDRVLALRDVPGFAGAMPAVRAQRLISTLSDEQLRDLEKRASGGHPRRSLRSVLRLDLGILGAGAIQETLEWLRLRPDVLAIESEARAAVNLAHLDTPAPAMGAIHQRYLRGGGVGVNVDAVDSGNRGFDVGFADIEQGWYLEHRDFGGRFAPPLIGDNKYRPPRGIPDGQHGAMVLGIISASGGVVNGIAHGALPRGLFSHFVAAQPGIHAAAAVAGAVPYMSAGDVLLLETQLPCGELAECSLPVAGCNMPIEADHDVWQAIRIAVDNDIVVVEAAGNGGRHSSQWCGGFGDSGAIVVGAVSSNPPHVIDEDSNHGTRVDCYAWGDDVWTTSAPPRVYDQFSETSAAAAIVAGVVLVLQSAALHRHGAVLSPAKVRALLRRSDLGTRVFAAGHPNAGVGVMPDLGQLIAAL